MSNAGTPVWAEQTESVVLCEGFHDRAFWAGWLGHLGCEDVRDTPSVGRDPFGHLVSGQGHFGYRTKSRRFVRIVPCGGRDAIVAAAAEHLARRTRRPLRRLVVTIDDDTESGEAARQEGVGGLALGLPHGAGRVVDGQLVVDDGGTVVSLIYWHAPEPAAVGVPSKRALEQLVCDALQAVDHGRGEAVQSWLDAEPRPADIGPKDYAWSYMAKWHAEDGCERFYSALWEDEAVVRELTERLDRIGAWRIAEALAE